MLLQNGGNPAIQGLFPVARQLRGDRQVVNMARAHVILFGNFNGERTELVSEVAQEFGWKTLAARNLDELSASPEPAAVLVNLRTLGDCALPTVEAIRRAAPYSCILACLSFSGHIDWPELCEAGAFDSLHLPLASSEIRQTFGFVASSQQHGYLSHLMWLTTNVLEGVQPDTRGVHAECSQRAGQAAR